MKNNVALIGEVRNEPKVSTFKNGDKEGTLLSFSLATTKLFINKSGEETSSQQWHNIKVWGQLAKTMSEHIKSGMTISVDGEILYSKYTGEDKIDRYKTDIVASNIILLKA